MKKIISLIVILLVSSALTLVVYIRATNNETNKINVARRISANSIDASFKLVIENDFEIEIGFDKNYKLFSIKPLNEKGKEITSSYTWSKNNLTTIFSRIIFYNKDIKNLNISIYGEDTKNIEKEIDSAINTININNNLDVKINYMIK